MSKRSGWGCGRRARSEAGPPGGGQVASPDVAVQSNNSLAWGAGVNGDLLVQEYASLRNESLSAKQNQQTILQWTLGVIGVIIASCVASVAAMYEMAAPWQVAALLAITIMIGGVVPVIVACAFGIWLGEVDRMERAGRFLRAREDAWSAGLAKDAQPGATDVSALAIWESVLVNERLGYGKNKFGSAASCALFLFLFVVSLGAGVALSVVPVTPLARWLSQYSMAWAIGVPLGWAGLCVVVVLIIFARPLRELAKTSVSQDGHGE